jgi:hypothetical protein
MAKIGDIVNYHSGGSDTDNPSDGFVCAAIVTMTTEAWQPGYRKPDGMWVPTSDVMQPDPGHVHLFVFWPRHKDGSEIPHAQSDMQNVAEGTTHGCWSARA